MAATAMAISRDPVADRYGETDRRLREWGRWTGGRSENLGYPRSTGIKTLIERVKVFTKPAPKKAELRAARAAGDSKRIAQALGHAVHDLTARGKETRSMRPLGVGEVPPDVREIAEIVENLPNEMQPFIFRRYRWEQPDRIAADEMDIAKDHYQLRLRAAVAYVAEKLALRRKYRHH